MSLVFHGSFFFYFLDYCRLSISRYHGHGHDLIGHGGLELSEESM